MYLKHYRIQYTNSVIDEMLTFTARNESDPSLVTFFVGPRLNMTHATAWSYPARQPGLLAPHNLMLDHDSIMAMAMGHFFKDLDHRLPSGKQAHNYGKIHHAING